MMIMKPRMIQLLFPFLVALFILSLAACGGLTSQQKPAIPGWVPQKSGTDVSLRGICAVDAKIAWASGERGTCLRTTDGGDTWEDVRVPHVKDQDLRDIQAWDESTAVVMAVGEPARIFKTANGGTHWIETYFNETPGIFLDAMAFWDDKRGIAFGDPLEDGLFLLTTEDGGSSWERIPPETLPAPEAGEAGFAASGTCIAVSDEGHAWFGTGGTVSRIFRSADFGKTWMVDQSPLVAGEASTGIFSLAFKDTRTGVMVGGDYKNEAFNLKCAARTEDGGRTWTLSERQTAGYRSCAAFVDTPAGVLLIAVGPSGSDCSYDFGKTWKRFSETGFHSAGFFGANGWASGADGRIARFKLNIPPKNP